VKNRDIENREGLGTKLLCANSEKKWRSCPVALLLSRFEKKKQYMPSSISADYFHREKPIKQDANVR